MRFFLHTQKKQLHLQSQTDDSLAQQVEHNTFNVGVLGSSPRRITRNGLTDICEAVFTFFVDTI